MRGERKEILFNRSGHGNFDIAPYVAFARGELQRYDHPQAAIDEALKDLPKVAAG